MLRQFLRIQLPFKTANLYTFNTRQYSSTSNVNSKKERWDLYAGVLVERLPIVSKELNEQEKKFQEYLWQVEFENSLKSDHELRRERDIIQGDLIKKGKTEIDLDDTSSKQTAQDMEDLYSEELKAFRAAARTTADDAAQNVSSTNRCLDELLYLVIEQQLGRENHFLLPQGKRQDGETMRQTAERVLRETCGTQLQASFFSNVPCGFYKYKYPNEMRTESVGAKVFFYRASLDSGNVDKKVVSKFEWLTQELLENKLKSPDYARSVRKFLL